MESRKSWYIQNGGQMKGPFPESGLSKLYNVGAITKNTPTCLDGTQDWMPLSQTEVFRDMPPAAKRARGGAKGKIAAIVVAAVVLLTAGFIGFRLWNNTHSMTGGWQSKNPFGGTMTLYFQPNAKVGNSKMDVLYMRTGGDDKSQEYYYMVTKVSGGLYRIDYCPFSVTSGTLDETDEKQLTVTLRLGGGAQIDGIGTGFTAFSRIGDARAKTIVGLN